MLWLVVLVLVPLARAAWCPVDCRCDKNLNGAIEIICPGNEPVARLTLLSQPGVSALIQCTPAATSADFQLLEGLVTGRTPVLSIQQCPPPMGSIKNLTDQFGMRPINSFLFQSIRNLSDTIDAGFLEGLTNLTKLRLISNGLTNLPVDLLKDLNQLTMLDMRDNFLTIPVGFFRHVPNLTTLELGHNRMTIIEPGVFNGLGNLRLLNLWSNKLKKLEPGVLANLSKLHSLDLHSNNLETLPQDIFNPVPNLTNLNLFGNNFSTLPAQLFSLTSNLQVLRLNNNQRNLSLPDGFLSKLGQLKEVYLMNNGMETVPSSLFAESLFIVNISLAGNYFQTIPAQLLAQQTELEVLDLSNNRLVSLPDDFSKNLNKLKVLRLDRNRLTTISMGTFGGLVSLTSLNLERNRLINIHNYAFNNLTKLQTAQFSENQLSNNFFIANERYSPFRSCVNLEHLYLSNNSFTELADDWRLLLLKLRTLDLTHNLISTIQTADLQFLSPNLFVDLRHNEISRIQLVHFWLISSETTSKGSQLRMQLSSNPLYCDCNAFELSQYANHQMPENIYDSINLQMDELYCSQPGVLAKRRFLDVLPMELTCAFTEKCPESCGCAYRSADKALIVNCSSRGLSHIPEELPTLFGSNQTELLLEDNLLTFLPNVTPRGYDKVTQLFLSGNQLTYLPIEYLNPNLEVLTIDHNNFSIIEANTVGILNNDSSLRLIMLHENPWVCDCEALNFASLLRRRYQQISFLDKVVCSDGRSIIKLTLAELCPTPLGILIFCISAAVVGILIGIIAALYYRYHYAIRVWLYAHRCCLWLVTEEELDRDKKYDAFVSFSQKDEQFVIEELVPRLEANGSSLCLHYRDWVAGDWIPTQIARSVDSSRRTLVILSPNFLDSVWGRLEFRAAHKQALSEGRARVVMILYGDLPPMEQLDPELKAYISVNTYVKWGDPWFWEKLHYALPHTQLKKRKKDDKLELIRAAATPTTVPTTPPVLQIPSVIIAKEYNTSVAC